MSFKFFLPDAHAERYCCLINTIPLRVADFDAAFYATLFFSRHLLLRCAIISRYAIVIIFMPARLCLAPRMP